jgi:hypothetical protein
MTSYSTFAVTRQTSTASTLLRMASTNENLENYGKDDSSSIQNGIDVTEENMNQKNICDIEDSSAPQSPDNLDIDDSDSSDNEFGRLIAESKPSGIWMLGYNALSNTRLTGFHHCFLNF